MKTLNKYFPIVMCIMMILTIFNYYKYQNKVNNFINNSSSQIIVIENDQNFNKEIIKIKLENLTHQNVEIEQLNDKIYVKLRCPPSKKNYFINWLVDKKWLD